MAADADEGGERRGLSKRRLSDMDAVMAFWNDSKDDFQNIATKYANGIRWYAAKALRSRHMTNRCFALSA
jgi:hypothetical protein